MTDAQNVAAIVVTYYPDKDVIQNIRTYCDKVNKCYVIDNSEEQTEKFKKKLESVNNCEYISLKENKGIAKALNVGMKRAVADGYQWILTMDQDSRFENNIIEIFLEYINSHDCRKVCLLAP